MTTVDRVNEMHKECALAYMEQHMDQESRDDCAKIKAAEDVFRKEYPQEQIEILDKLLAIYREQEEICIHYGWQAGREMCLRSTRKEQLWFPYQDEAVSGYVRTEPLEELPAYRRLTEAVSELLADQKAENYLEFKFYHEDQESELLVISHYLGYLEGTFLYPGIKPDFAQNRELTAAYLRRMGDNAYIGRTEELLKA